MPGLAELGFTNNRRELTALTQTVSAPSYVETVEQITDAAQLGVDVVDDSAVSDVNVSKLTTGFIKSKQIELQVVPGAGDAYMGIGDFTPSAWTCDGGILFGIDDSDDDKVKWYMGNGTNWVDWNVTSPNTLTIAGTLVASEIHIPDQNVTDNSFHVDSDGSGWIGATEDDRATAPIQWSATGVWKVGDAGGGYIELDGPSGHIGTDDYVAGVSGWRIARDGSAEFANIVSRGVMYGSVFKYDEVSAIGGQMIVANSDSLESDMTALDSATMTIKGVTTLSVNDIIYMRGTTDLGIQTEYLRVTDVSAAPTYTVTRDLASAYASNNNPAWKAGTALVVIKNSDLSSSHSGGYLLMLGQGTNSPYYSVLVSSGVGYNDFTEVGRLGNLNGIGGFSSDTFGLFLGDYAGGKYASYDNVSGELTINGRVNGLFGFGGDGSDGALNVTSGTTTLNLDQIYNFSSINVASGATLKFTTNSSGEGAGGYLNCSGDVTIAGTIDLENTVEVDQSGATLRDNLEAGTPMGLLDLNGGGAASTAGGVSGGAGGDSDAASGSPGTGGAAGTSGSKDGSDGEGGNSSVGGGGGGGAYGDGTITPTAGSTTATSAGGAGGTGGRSNNGSVAGGSGGSGGGGYDTGNGGDGGDAGDNVQDGTPGIGGNGGNSGENGGNGGDGGDGGSGGASSGIGGGNDGGNGGNGYTNGGNGGDGGDAFAGGGGAGARDAGDGGDGGIGTHGTGGTGGNGGSGGSNVGGGNGGNGGDGRTGGAGGIGGTGLRVDGNGGNGGNGTGGAAFLVIQCAGDMNLNGMVIDATGGDGGNGGIGGSSAGGSGDGGNGGDAGDGSDIILLCLGTLSGTYTVNNQAGTAGSGGAAGSGSAGSAGAVGSDGALIVTEIKQM